MLDFGLIKDSDDDFDVDAEVTRVLVADFEKEGLLKMAGADHRDLNVACIERARSHQIDCEV